MGWVGGKETYDREGLDGLVCELTEDEGSHSLTEEGWGGACRGEVGGWVD